MLRHYIKMAMRHLLKNKIQNLISIVGLSVGGYYVLVSVFIVAGSSAK